MDFIHEFFSKNLNLNWEMICAVSMIILCPITFTLVARYEFHTKRLSNFFGNNVLAADITAYMCLEMGIFRNFMFQRVIFKTQFDPFPNFSLFVEVIGYLILVTGFHLNFLAYYRLGIHGIYYGDYFGVLCKEMVTAYPYNILNNPLYVGSIMLYLGSSIIYRSPSGILLTVLAWFMYKIVGYLENPMTMQIYSPENIQRVHKYNEEKERRLSNKVDEAKVH